MQEQSLKEKTAKGLFWGGLSNGIQQLLNLFFGIFLARLLSPSDYGMVGMLTIFSAIAGVLQEGGFISALTNKKNVTHQDYNAVFWFSVLVGSTLYILLFFCAPLIAEFYGIEELTPLARYIFLGFLFSSVGMVHNAILFRNLMVKQRSIAMISGLFISGCVGVTMAFLGFAYWGIATQSIVYVATVNLFYIHFSHWKPSLKINLAPLKEMIGFSSKIIITKVFYHINNNILTVILGKLYTKHDVGYFTQANKWTTIGHSLVNEMVHLVAQPVFTTVADDKERQLRVFRKMLRFTAFVAFPMMLGLALISEELIIITITDKWIPSVALMKILCVGGAFIPINNLYANLIISKGKSNIYMWNTIALGITQLGCILYLHEYSIKTLVTAYVSIQILWLFVWNYFVWKEIHMNLWNTLKDILPFAGIAALVMASTHFATCNIESIYLVFILKIILASILYTALLWISGSITFRECLEFLRKNRKSKV